MPKRSGSNPSSAQVEVHSSSDKTHVLAFCVLLLKKEDVYVCTHAQMKYFSPVCTIQTISTQNIKDIFTQEIYSSEMHLTFYLPIGKILRQQLHLRCETGVNS